MRQRPRKISGKCFVVGFPFHTRSERGKKIMTMVTIKAIRTTPRPTPRQIWTLLERRQQGLSSLSPDTGLNSQLAMGLFGDQPQLGRKTALC